MHEKLNNFTQNQVWILEEPPQKWVFRNKTPKNFSQVEGLHFGETFAPVARLKAIHILLAYASNNNIKLYQMDVKSAFLNGFINELVYVEQPRA
jgi:hypothetical protein